MPRANSISRRSVDITVSVPSSSFETEEAEAKNNRQIEQNVRERATVRLPGNASHVIAAELYRDTLPDKADNVDALTEDEIKRELAKNALDCINRYAGCSDESMKSKEQRTAEKKIRETLRNQVLIIKTMSYTGINTMNGVLREANKMEENNEVPSDCILLFEPEIIVAYYFLNWYKGLSGASGGVTKCRFFAEMEKRDQLPFLKTAYNMYGQFDYHCRIVRLRNVPEWIQHRLSNSTPTDTNSLSDEDQEMQAPDVRQPEEDQEMQAPDVPQSEGGDQSTIPHFRFFRILPTSSKKSQCGLYAIASSLVAQGHAVLTWGDSERSNLLDELRDTVASKAYGETIRRRSGDDAVVSTSWFKEEELALLLQMWGEMKQKELQLGFFHKIDGERLSPRPPAKGLVTVWIYHDSEGHWSGLSFRESSEPSSPRTVCKIEDASQRDDSKSADNLSDGSVEATTKEEEEDDYEGCDCESCNYEKCARKKSGHEMEMDGHIEEEREYYPNDTEPYPERQTSVPSTVKPSYQEIVAQLKRTEAELEREREAKKEEKERADRFKAEADMMKAHFSTLGADGKHHPPGSFKDPIKVEED